MTQSSPPQVYKVSPFGPQKATPPTPPQPQSSNQQDNLGTSTSDKDLMPPPPPPKPSQAGLQHLGHALRRIDNQMAADFLNQQQRPPANGRPPNGGRSNQQDTSTSGTYTSGTSTSGTSNISQKIMPKTYQYTQDNMPDNMDIDI